MTFGHSCLLVAAAAVIAAGQSAAQTCALQRLSKSVGGAAANGTSGYVTPLPRCAISGDGRFAAFTSAASDLVAGDGNGLPDLFVVNIVSGAVERASVALGGGDANGASYWPSFSQDGRYLAYCTFATNIAPPDVNPTTGGGSLLGSDIVVLDRSTGVTTCVSRTSSGVQAVGFSAYPEISADGRFVTFTSDSVTLDPGDTQDIEDVFVVDRTTGVCTKESVATDGSPGTDHSGLSVISADGRFVAFRSASTNFGAWHGFIDVVVRDRQLQTTTVLSTTIAYDPSISADGRYVAYLEHPNLAIWVHDRITGTRSLASRAVGGGMPNSFSGHPRLSPNGRWVVFESAANDIVSADTNGANDVLLYDASTDRRTRISAVTSGVEGNARSGEAAVSDDGTVVFATLADNLVALDANATWDVVVTTCPPFSPGEPFCFGDGPTNGGPDCPCSNNVAIGVARGCTNSTGNGGKLVATGNASLSADAVTLTGSDMATASFSLFLQSPTNRGAAPYFFDGLRCVGPSFVRLTTKMSVAGAAAIGSSSTPISILGGIASPGTQYYQVVYRNNAGLCNFLANSTNGVAVVWAP